MLILSYLLTFIFGVVLTVFLLQDEIYHGRKVGYGEGDINPDKGVYGCDN